MYREHLHFGFEFISSAFVSEHYSNAFRREGGENKVFEKLRADTRKNKSYEQKRLQSQGRESKTG